MVRATSFSTCGFDFRDPYREWTAWFYSRNIRNAVVRSAETQVAGAKSTHGMNHQRMMISLSL
jgi:hypothetical protein